MKLKTAFIVIVSIAQIENVQLNNDNQNDYNFLLSDKPIHDFINLFQKFHHRSNNLRRMKRAFDKSENSMDTSEQEKIIDALPDKTLETLEDEKLKLELGQKYNTEFKNLLKMDGIELEKTVVDQLNQSLVDMFTDTMKETMNRFKHHENDRIISTNQIPEIYNTIKSIMYNKTEAYYLHHTNHVFQKFKLFVKQDYGIPDYYKIQFKLKNYQLPSYQKLVAFWNQEINIDVKYLQYSVVLRRYINAFYNDLESTLFHEYLYPLFFQNELCQKSKWRVDNLCPYKFNFSNYDQPVKVAHQKHQKFGEVQFPQMHAFDYV